MFYWPAEKGPQRRDPGPLFAPNNHSESVDVFWSLPSHAILGQLPLENWPLIIVHPSEALVTSGEVTCPLGQLEFVQENKSTILGFTRLVLTCLGDGWSSGLVPVCRSQFPCLPFPCARHPPHSSDTLGDQGEAPGAV